jgi:hypothetical protein
VQRLVENPLSNQIIEGKFKAGDKIVADIKNNEIAFEKAGQAALPKEEPAEKNAAGKSKKKPAK